MGCRVLLFAGLLVGASAFANPVKNLDGLIDEVTVYTDVDGIPHIIAQNEADLVFIQGYIHARDRYFQMDALRRQSSGTLAELLGESALGDDFLVRAIGLRRAAERSFAAVSKETLAALQSYANGVNTYIALNGLPAEYPLLETTSVVPWEPLDSLTLAKALAFNLSFDLDVNLTLELSDYQGAGVAQGFDGAALFFEDIYRSAPFEPASTVPDATGANRAAAKKAADRNYTTDYLEASTLQMADRLRDSVKDSEFLRQSLWPGKKAQGSNEWMVGGEKSATGLPIMANDPHLALNTPATFYQNHLFIRGELNVVGSSFPGVPFVVLGQNDRISWGATTNPLDVTDTFQEQLVLNTDGFNIMHDGELELLDIIQAQFFANVFDGADDNLVQIISGAPPFLLTVPRRNNGPIVDFSIADGTAISIQYTGLSATREVDTFRAWNYARSLADFRDGLDYFDFGSQNWSVMDREGGYGYFTSAELPLREDLQAGTVNGLPPYFIRNGIVGNEWLPVENPQPGQAIPYEILPYAEMPQVINPSEGYFVNANNDPIGNTLDNDVLNDTRPGGGIYYLNPGYANGTRAGRITKRLQQAIADNDVVSVADMQSIQADVGLLDAEVFVPYIVDAFAFASVQDAWPLLGDVAADKRVGEAVSRLVGWDYTTPTGVSTGYDASDVDGAFSEPDSDEIASSIAATIYSVWRGQVIRNVIDDTLAGVSLDPPDDDRALAAIRVLLDGFDKNQGVGASGLNFFAVDGIADAGASRDYLLLRSLADALDLLAGPAFETAFGGSTNQGDYRWGRLHRIVMDTPLGAPFDIPPAGGVISPSFDDLAGLATDGGYGVVDAASHNARADSAEEFRFGSGPVRRYVATPIPQTQRGAAFFEAQTILPGGNSGVLSSPFYANLLGRWLTNDTYPVRHALSVAISASTIREQFRPVEPAAR